MNHDTTLAVVVLVLYLTAQCFSIRVPVAWNNGDNSEVQSSNNEQLHAAVETFDPLVQQQQPVPLQYFQYTAPKPQFAVDVATYHGVPNPEQHYKAYPVRPYTGKAAPELGKHRILDQRRPVFKEFQRYIKDDDNPKEHVTTISSNYEVVHPYQDEVSGLQEIYKDPILDKIRNDIRSSKDRLQNYEKEAGNSDISSDEYLESLDQTDHKQGPQKNIPASYENHRPLRRPAYYRVPPKLHHRDQYLNHKYRNPWNQYAKVRPVNYRPLKNHLQRLRHHQAHTFDDEHNEYPQLPPPQNFAEPPDGYDIYEKGKDRYNRLRNNLDESINQSIRENRPTTYENLEMQDNHQKEDLKDNNEEDFVPIRNYAQVRKTETYKHLPRKAAFEDADSYDEIKNAPRLKEAVKSTKAQTVYSEEGYEDAAYDHAGEQKHADDHEAHGGFLREKELSGGNYKTPSVSHKYEDSSGSLSKDQIQDAKKWKDSLQDTEEENHAENNSEDEKEHSSETELQDDTSEDNEEEEPRNKRENEQINDEEESDVDTSEESSDQLHDVSKREADFKVPEINLNTTYLSEDDLLTIGNIKDKLQQKPKKDTIRSKYPYYFKNLGHIHRNSPLRYAENLKLIPFKSKSETAFYDSRSKLQCPEVDDEIDPVPEQLKNGEKPNSEESDENNKGETEVSQKEPRLKGLGDKIDCFKAKYFGKNPLDSPFFKEEVITNPEPLLVPKSSVFELLSNKRMLQSSKVKNIQDKIRTDNEDNIFSILNNFTSRPIIANTTSIAQQNKVYADVVKNHNNLQVKQNNVDEATGLSPNITYIVFQKKEDVTKLPPTLDRKKRSTSFTYEPYKTIRIQSTDPKKSRSFNSRQLQQGRSVDSILFNDEEMDQPVKRNIHNRSYINIGRNERALSAKGDKPTEISFITTDDRRGEPRYEIKVENHKSEYVPVENRKSMSLKDYNDHKKSLQNFQPKFKKEGEEEDSHLNIKANNKYSIPKRHSRKLAESQDTSASSTIKKIMSSSTIAPNIKTTTIVPTTEVPINDDSNESFSSEEDYDEDDGDEASSEEDLSDEENDDEENTTTTTQKPIFRKRVNQISSTTAKPVRVEEEDMSHDDHDEEPRLKLTTRFREIPIKEKNRTNKNKNSLTEKTSRKAANPGKNTPQISEKKKKSSKSTLVTDSNRYGDDEDDMRKEEVDALIGVKQDMDDYVPLYEKEQQQKESESSEEAIDETDEQREDSATEDSDDDDIEDEDDAGENSEESAEKTEEITTAEPTKRTLIRTTEPPTSTTESRIARIREKPTVLRKKIEIHKELPNNKTSPHITQFKQDIKEIEIIKETPAKIKRRRPQTSQKNIEALELYKDEKLATEVNKLGAVEVFKENLDLTTGPKHGGNYRSANIISTSEAPRKRKNDARAASSRSSKIINKNEEDIDELVEPANKVNERETNRNRAHNEKLIELEEERKPQLHGGNLKAPRSEASPRAINKNARLIELDDDHEDESDDDSFKSRNYYNRGNLHGGNYKSARLLAQEKGDGKKKDARHSAAAVLNSFARVAPILTTTPAYILDPSKRMYYYVDT